MKQKQKVIFWLISIVLLTFVVGCRKKVPVAAAPRPPQAAPIEAAKPNPPAIVEFAAEPGRIERGQTAVLRWQVKDATRVEINQGIGTVSVSGRRQIAPTDSTTYTLVAVGPGGSATAKTTLDVTQPPPAPVAPAVPKIGERLMKEVQDAFFDFDKSDLREDARVALTRDAEALKKIMSDFPNETVVIEGHCDERGSAEYNLALGDRRATSASEFLTVIGVPGDRLIKISYGKERPQCTESNETCWAKNRRVHFVQGEGQQPKLTTRSNKSVAGHDPAPKD
jgi:peptidoglycan-associated lipoprotein